MIQAKMFRFCCPSVQHLSWSDKDKRSPFLPLQERSQMQLLCFLCREDSYGALKMLNKPDFSSGVATALSDHVHFSKAALFIFQCLCSFKCGSFVIWNGQEVQQGICMKQRETFGGVDWQISRVITFACSYITYIKVRCLHNCIKYL